jgi:hypothetical protein
MEWDDRVLMSGPLPGKTGLCDWTSVKIVNVEARVKCGWGHIGPRKLGQLSTCPSVEGDGLVRVFAIVGPSRILDEGTLKEPSD